ncbi:MAG: hypothetical protein LBP83_05450 [Dysgonamonadaceae bacterium]|jgi:hypothetical protein|nr:hypothetical protein [Dysgonamonadaceae bacterium]
MDNLSEYLPLIIIIGSIIVSVIKGTGKKAMEKTAKTTLPGKIPEEVIPSVKPVSLKARFTEKKTPANPTAKPVKTKASETFKANTKIALGTFIEEPEYIKPVLDVHNQDEIKQAFIYSEILKRKEY